MSLLHRSAVVFVTLALAATPAVAGDFTQWSQPSQPQWCHLEVERMYQTADMKPLHAVLVNKGLGGMQVVFEVRATGRYKPLILGTASFTIAPNEKKDVILNKPLAAKDAAGGFDLAIKTCT